MYELGQVFGSLVAVGLISAFQNLFVLLLNVEEANFSCVSDCCLVVSDLLE